MRHIILSSLLALGVLAFVAPDSAHAAKQKKKESEVQKALKDAYPDAQTQITNTSEVNGVKVYDVKVTTKTGESTAQITDYGDFLMYGVPHEYGAIKNLIATNVSGLFKSAPDDIDMYRVTNYSVDFPGSKGKTYAARFDAVGRLKDVYNTSELQRESGKNAHGEKASDAEAKKVDGFVKKYMPDAQIEGVYKSEQGGNFYYADLKNGEMIVNDQGQVYSFREEIDPKDLPEPVQKSIAATFSAQPTKAYRGEYEYYQFNQQSQTGEPIVVKMRPNGDILEVRNDKARADEEALQAKSKQGAAPAAKQKG